MSSSAIVVAIQSTDARKEVSAMSEGHGDGQSGGGQSDGERSPQHMCALYCV